MSELVPQHTDPIITRGIVSQSDVDVAFGRDVFGKESTSNQRASITDISYNKVHVPLTRAGIGLRLKSYAAFGTRVLPMAGGRLQLLSNCFERVLIRSRSEGRFVN